MGPLVIPSQQLPRLGLPMGDPMDEVTEESFDGSHEAKGTATEALSQVSAYALCS